MIVLISFFVLTPQTQIVKVDDVEFEIPAEVEFEGHCFPCCSCWDSYLSGIYGDYMQLPPPEKRKAHDVEAYLLEESDL